MSDVFYKDKIKVNDINDNCHIGVVFNKSKYKIVESKNNAFFPLKKGEDPKGTFSRWTKQSKQEYLKSAKGCNIEEAKIFRDEESLDKWLNDEL